MKNSILLTISVTGMLLSAMLMTQGCGFLRLGRGLLCSASCHSDAPLAGQNWRIKKLGMALVWIPPGEFLMGSISAEREWAASPEGRGDAKWYTHEGDSLMRVQIDQGFWMGQTMVTRDMFRRFVEEDDYLTEAELQGGALVLDLQFSGFILRPGKSWREPRFEQENNHPVVCITWNDALAFCEWLTRIEKERGRLPEGYEYRLPGEAEWEYAARGGERERTMFWWGDSLADGRGRFNGAGTDLLPDGTQWAHGYGWEDGFAFTSPVDYYGARGRNGFGLADMLGNAWEWCYDGYDDNGPHATVWQGDTSRRVLRGGTFYHHPGTQRLACRGSYPPGRAFSLFGFRVVLAPQVVSRQD